MKHTERNAIQYSTDQTDQQREHVQNGVRPPMTAVCEMAAGWSNKSRWTDG